MRIKTTPHTSAHFDTPSLRLFSRLAFSDSVPTTKLSCDHGPAGPGPQDLVVNSALAVVDIDEVTPSGSVRKLYCRRFL